MALTKVTENMLEAAITTSISDKLPLSGGTLTGGLDVTGTVTADGLTVDGTTKIGFTSAPTWDTNSYLYSISGDGLHIEGFNQTFSTGLSRTNRLKITSDGDISFYEDTGTTAKFSWSSANETISIGTGASSTATISAYSRTVSASLPSALRIIENTGASSYWDIGSDGGASPNLKFYVNANTTPKVTFTGTGNVGIGTSSPQNKVDVISANADGRLAIKTQNTSGSATVEAQVNGYWSTPTYTGTAIVQHDSAVSGTESGIAKASLGVLRFQNVAGGLIYTNGGSPIIFGTTSTERMRISSAGNVGIGTTSPATALDVSGTATANQFKPGNVTTTATSKTLAVGEFCTVTAATQTITLPASPSAGDNVTVSVGNFADTVIGRNGSNIMGAAEDLTLDVVNAGVTLMYSGDATQGWRII